MLLESSCIHQRHMWHSNREVATRGLEQFKIPAADAVCLKVASSLKFCAHGSLQSFNGSLQSFSTSDKIKGPKTDPPGGTTFDPKRVHFWTPFEIHLLCARVQNWALNILNPVPSWGPVWRPTQISLEPCCSNPAAYINVTCDIATARWQPGASNSSRFPPRMLFVLKVASSLKFCAHANPIDWISLFSDYYLRLVVFIYFLEIGYHELPKYLQRFCLLSYFFGLFSTSVKTRNLFIFLTIFQTIYCFLKLYILFRCPGIAQTPS